MADGFSFGDLKTGIKKSREELAEEEPDWVKSSPEELIEKAATDYLMQPELRPFDDYYHPSQIYDMCPVAEFWVRIRRPENLIREPQFGLNLMAAAGTAAHDYFQNGVFGPAKLLWGTWKCTNCTAVYRDTLLPDFCTDEMCGCNRLQFVEPAILNHAHKIRGHADGKFVIPESSSDAKKLMLEMKSKSAKAWPNYNKPSKKERVQGSIYLDCLGLDECAYVFICRDDYRYKIVIEEKKQDLVDQAYHTIDSIEECVAAGKPDSVLMCQRKCGSAKTAKARQCAFKHECWGAK